MIKLVVLYGQPEDPAAFEEHYVTTHFPLADRMPHVRRVEMAKGIAGPDGSPAPYYRIAEVYFDSMDDLVASNESPAGQVTRADVPNFATGGATVFVAEVV